ncbi:MAG TPA: T9SS type A sorting domain-containing protein [Gemmatimonadales bacterium]|nr:T9SS type A sorting domain-containing protein [Gemmatimonadales bacterium]
MHHAAPSTSHPHLAAVACGVALALLASGNVGAQQLEMPLWGTDGVINALARSGDVIYAAGAFRSVGPPTGGAVLAMGASGSRAAAFPRVTGSVSTAIDDGDGGWFLGGSFSAVAGLPRANLAHVLADGTVDPWTPDPDGSVMALTREGHRLYVGGAFTHAGGERRDHLAGFEEGGRLSGWNPDADGDVLALAAHGHTLYAGGRFTRIAQQPRMHLSAIDARSGSAAPGNWNVNGPVQTLAVRGSTLYVGGDFRLIDNARRGLLAAIDCQSGALLPWNPNVTGPDDPYGPDPSVRALVLESHAAIVGGYFSAVGDSTRGGLAEIDLGSGLATPWDARLGPWAGPYPPAVNALSLAGDVLYVGGDFESVLGEQRKNAAAVTLSRASVLPWNPRANNAVDVLARSASGVFIGGRFTSVGPEWQSRQNLAAFDARTGTVTNWQPDVTSLDLTAIAISGTDVLVGGDLTAVDGQPRTGLAAIDALSGEPTAWAPNADGPVRSLLVDDATVYAGGTFRTVGGQRRPFLAALDRQSGQATPWNPQPNDLVRAIAIDGTKVYVAGVFRAVAGSRRIGLAALDRTSGAVLPWNPNPDAWTNALSATGGQLYAGGAFHTLGDTAHLACGAVDTTTGAARPWSADANGEVYALAAAHGVVYVGGAFDQIGDAPRSGLAAVNGSSGALLSWNPDPRGIVRALLATPEGVLVGGEFTQMQGLPVMDLAVVPEAITKPERALSAAVPSASADMALLCPNPVRADGELKLSVSRAALVSLAVYDVQGRCMVRLIDQRLMQAGTHPVPFHTAGWRPGLYFYRLQAGRSVLTKKVHVVE